jgi:hypothetical protein
MEPEPPVHPAARGRGVGAAPDTLQRRARPRWSVLPIGVGFGGIAKSIDFGGTVNQIAFDDITFGSTTPGDLNPVPEPGTLLLFASLAWIIHERRGRCRPGGVGPAPGGAP